MVHTQRKKTKETCLSLIKVKCFLRSIKGRKIFLQICLYMYLMGEGIIHVYLHCIHTVYTLRLKYENYFNTNTEKPDNCVGTTRAVKTDSTVFTTSKCSNMDNMEEMSTGM